MGLPMIPELLVVEKGWKIKMLEMSYKSRKWIYKKTTRYNETLMRHYEDQTNQPSKIFFKNF